MLSYRILRNAAICLLLLALPVLSQETDKTSPPAPASVATPNGSASLYFYFINASNETGESSKMPAAIEPAIKQLKDDFPYRSYRVQTVSMVQTTTRTAFSSDWKALACIGLTDKIASYKIQGVVSRKLSDNSLELQQVRFDINAPIGLETRNNREELSYERASFTASFNLLKHEPVVVGMLQLGRGEAGFVVVVLKNIRSYPRD